jgi:RHS repeat-associated protein
MFGQRLRAGVLARTGFPATFPILLIIAGATLLSASAQATTAAGRTKGTFVVSPTGAATYTIPIWAPPGPQGLQPNIALTYNSQLADAGDPTPAPAGSQSPGRPIPVDSTQASLNWAQASNGYLGVGWSLQGLSSIYRCNLTFAQDAAPAPIALVTSDGYCMAGQRLRLTGGTYGEAGSTYQTEVANFVNVTAYGTAGNGPAYWIAQDRNGRTYYYGDGNSSQVVAAGTSTAISWMLNEISDPYGNTMTISYLTTNATSAVVPSVISWTPSSHGSSTYNYTMTFTYNTNGTNAPQSSVYKYVAGSSVTNTNLLSSIAIAYSGTAVKTYYLTYQASPTTLREELTQVQECAASGTSNCLSPTVMTYQNGEAGTATSPTTALSSAPSQLTPADFNGDGLTDLAYCSGSTIYVSFASASGYGTPVNTGAACGGLVGDLLGQGQEGILANHSGTWYYYNWNGSSFTATSTGLAYDSTAAQFVLNDVNGDGLPDLVSLYWNGGSVTVYTRLNTSSGTTPSFSTSTTEAFSQSGEFTDAQIAGSNLDFNGDGRKDIALVIVNQGSKVNVSDTYELISTGTAFTATLIESKPGAYLPLTFLNFNSDACTDYLSPYSDTIFVSGCNGSAPTTVTVPGGAAVIGAMDWNGDGRTDILVANGSTIGVYLSTGIGLSSSMVTTSVPYNTANQYFTFNANGDGLDDLGVWNQTSFAVSYFPHNDPGQPPDLLSSVTDAFGNSSSPTYVSIAQSNYERSNPAEFPDAAYPYQDYIGPLYVVNEAVFSDPSSSSGGTYNLTYSYYGAWTNLQGRGWQSFYEIRAGDSRNGLYYYGYFEREFPWTGVNFQPTVTNSVFTIWYSLATEAPVVTLSSTQYQERYFPYFSNVTQYQYEVGGTENNTLITTTSTNYTYDNYGSATSIATTVTDNDPNSPYKTDTWTTTTTNTPDESTNPWCLSLFSQSQVAYTASNGSTSVTTTKTLTPDTTHCDYTQIVTQSNSGSAYAVTEALGYDAFGNVYSDTVTGASMTGRVTTANWGTTGQLPMSVTDPSNATTQFNYNFSYGLKSSTTDPNGLTTSWLYDGFGRETQETRPDGTYTTWTYQNCATTTGCLLNTPGLYVIHDVYNTNATVQSSGATWFDPIDRPLVSTQIMMNGSTYSRNELRYDSLGRVSQRAFPCTYSSFTTTCTYWTTNSYDVLNRLTQSQRPISSTNSNLQTTTYAYAGRTTTVTDPLSNTKTAVTDVNGWLRRTTDPMGYYVTLAYDAAGSKTAVTDSLSNNLWSGTYNYGIAAFPATITDIDMGKWSYTYDALGERTAWTDAKSQSFSETYDALSRPLTRTEPDLFTQWTWGSSASSHNIYKLQSVCTGTGSSPTNCTTTPGYSESETYDSLSRLSQRTMTLPGEYGGSFTYTWGYNATTGLLNTLTYPVSYPSTYSLELQYGYSEGILQTVTDVSDSPNVTVWEADTTNPAGQITEETLGNGIVTNRSYDAVTGWLGSAQSGVGGGSGVKNLAFLYDEMGDVTQRQDNNLGLTENIYYDNDYRFSYSTLNGTQNLSVSYTTNGNISSRTDVASGASWTYSATQIHAVTQAGSSAYQYVYDANGNATSRQGSSISWSSYNYPTSISAGSGSTAETVTLSYGPNRQRWQQYYSGNSTTETTDYVGRLLEVVASGGVTDYRHYVYGGAGVVAVYSRKSSGTNTFSYLLSDHQASAASITNSSGAQVVGESFTAFGNRRNPTTWSGADTNTDLTTIAGITREGYTFQTALGLWMGMNHMNGRVQDAVTGRILSADPSVPDPTNTQDYNRYSYVDNNPLTYNDPSGFDPLDGCDTGDSVICNEVPYGLPSSTLQSLGLYPSPLYPSTIDVNAPPINDAPGELPGTGNLLFALGGASISGPWLQQTLPPVGIGSGMAATSTAATVTVTGTRPSGIFPWDLNPPMNNLFLTLGYGAGSGGTGISSPGTPQGNQNQSPTCWATGISFSFSTINPFTSGGGGTYGLNIEWTKGTGLAVYTYGTPNTTPSQGFLLGAGVSLNAATGRGPWSGLFDSTTGAYGPVNGGFFESPPGGKDPGYFGLEIGAGPGLPGVGSTTTNYTPVLQLTHPAPNGCTKGH